jgi:hypothetical protein
MKIGRYSFGSAVIQERYVYVYGGIVGQLKDSNKPILADIPVERFDYHTN